MKKDLIKLGLEQTIENRTNVLENLPGYDIDEKHRTKLEENLKFFQDRYNKLYPQG